MLPAKVRVKLLPEAVGYITVAQVMHREFSMAELMGFLLPVAGKDKERIRQLLRAGSVIAGDYRIRWDSLEVGEQELDVLLEALPHADPSRAFQPETALQVRFCRGHHTLDLSRETASRKPLFARQSFWDGLLGFFRERVRYADYSHADKADVFAAEVDAEGLKMLESLLPLARPRNFAARLERLKPERIEWLVRR